MVVELHESNKTLAEVVDQAAAGEEVILMRDGKAVARVTAVDQTRTVTPEQARGRLGFLKGKFTVPDDIKTPFAKEIEKMFYGNPDKFNR